MKSKKETIYKRIMDSRGMKATQLAGKSGLAESTVSDILNGKRKTGLLLGMAIWFVGIATCVWILFRIN